MNILELPQEELRRIFVDEGTPYVQGPDGRLYKITASGGDWISEYTKFTIKEVPPGSNCYPFDSSPDL